VIDYEQDLRRIMAESERAKALLDDPLLASAFADLEAKWTMAWKNSPARDSAGREQIWLHLKALEEVKGALEARLQDGQVARHQLDELRSGALTNPL
jgi:hypothetical protein